MFTTEETQSLRCVHLESSSKMDVNTDSQGLFRTPYIGYRLIFTKQLTYSKQYRCDNKVEDN